MPSKSKAQHNLMAGCAHGWSPSKGKCPPRKVAKEFVQADKGRSLGEEFVASARSPKK